MNPADTGAAAGPARTPVAEVVVDEALVRALLADQHPDLVSQPLRPAASGWDNATYRLGDDAAVRLPRRGVAAELARNEQVTLPRIAPGLPLPTPTPLRTGVPSDRFPWPWSVVPWFDGEAADLQPPADDEAAALGSFLRALHVPAPSTAPENRFRGVPLAERELGFDARIARLAADGWDVTPLTAAWRAARAAPVATDAPAWLHGDLHPRNLLVDGDRLAAVIDWGDVTSGDRATDLAAVWLLWDVAVHPVFADAYGDRDPALWARAAGWAALFTGIFLEVGDDDERFLAIGRRALDRLRTTAAAGGSS
ncbi:phosphotransferase [Nitriliruptor alkaliphilus]|uniref:phosphotransferase n=1 Tax=Nitriliruptor alkaliphilus TaxID=427918 RepID=UPI0006984F9C|nr:phosphotransferase [Nitriliruptor alkaliphilus]